MNDRMKKFLSGVSEKEIERSTVFTSFLYMLFITTQLVYSVVETARHYAIGDSLDHTLNHLAVGIVFAWLVYMERVLLAWYICAFVLAYRDWRGK